MAATHFLSSFSALNSVQFHSVSPISSSLNQNQNPPKTLKSKNSETSLSANPISKSNNAAIKMPTAPWMRSPLDLQSGEISDRKKPRIKEKFERKADKALTEKVSGVRGNKVMRKIIRNIEKLQENEGLCDNHKKFGELKLRECFEKLGSTSDEDEVEGFGGKMPWMKEEKIVVGRMKRERVGSQVEKVLDGDLIQRLRNEAKKMRKWVKVKKAGVTESVVGEIRSAWRKSELAMVKFDVPLCRNMDRAREIVELKTGGLVIWSKKDVLFIYRGYPGRLTSKSSPKTYSYIVGDQEAPWSRRHLNSENNVKFSQLNSAPATLVESMHGNDGGEEYPPASIFMEENFRSQPITGSLYEREADRLLDGLGPRFIDWWMWKPLPVDADLLPEIVPGFKPPFRLCLPEDRSKLTDDELTYLRKLAHSLPTHFVLGRNRKLQGLAEAILKLWEKSLIAKIAVKWGIPNTSNEQMANELKCLTGGDLLLRNKFFIILYRGKDFLPSGAADLILERELELQKRQISEEDARLKAIETFRASDEAVETISSAGSLSEFKGIQTELQNWEKGNTLDELQLESEKEELERELRWQERKLFILNIKIQKSAKELSKLNSKWIPSEQDVDQEVVTYEERECFRKIGLKMKSNLLLGRRGIFDGVIESLHQHWKHREVAKVISMQRSFRQVFYTARSLVAESGGILVSVDKLKEGHAIVIYRGKNYRRPLKLMTENLLTKREALKRSLEMQRLGSLKFFAYQRQRAISDLKLKLAKLQESRENYLEVTKLPYSDMSTLSEKGC